MPKGDNPNSLKNLKSFKSGVYSERQKMGTDKSVKVRKELKEIREWSKNNLFDVRGENKIPLYQLLFKKLEQLSIQGNIRAIEMLLNYSGLKPIEQIAEVDTEGNDKTNITFNIIPIDNKNNGKTEKL